MKWINRSDSNTRFYVCESSIKAEIEGSEVTEIFRAVIIFILKELIPAGTAFDTFFLEVNCDTGRLIFSAASEEDRKRGTLNGCSIRLTKLQEFWDELVKNGVRGQNFDIMVVNEVIRISQVFRDTMEEFFDEIRSKTVDGTLLLKVFDTEPETIVFEHRFE